MREEWIGGKELEKALGVKARMTRRRHLKRMIELGFPVRFAGNQWQTTKEAVKQYIEYQTKVNLKEIRSYNIDDYIKQFTKKGRKK